MSQPSPLKRKSHPEIPEQNRIVRLDLGVGLKEVWEIMLKIEFGFPCCFFFRVMVPLNFVHFDGFPPSASFFDVQDFDWMFDVG
jgi:hypothetical protein